MNEFLKCLRIATIAHSGQIRKTTNLPFLLHPVRVATLLERFDFSPIYKETLMCAAILHDVSEDCNLDALTLRNLEVHEEIVKLIVELTNNTDDLHKYELKELYLQNKLSNMSEAALLIKLADMYDNFTDKPSVTSKERIINLTKFIERRVSFLASEDNLNKAIHTMYGILKLAITEEASNG